ncbi:SDR family NAD(P)-dependent oxidoreductase [Phyllobacterium sp. 22229]|jgi:galactose dehydrogenase|uniref:3-oxoacyl-ACP reductase n=1 Tax=Phyllobacterium myrsinacearum TaxID=28101 RepID=A0A2S9JQE6_9HYPH|nr:SDR family oxidoreductase [Phyllobacterium myrsinacearum]PRD55458.1 3-oxoacyl-ACP reductase [Phyllobacterium myrsinacearum]PWV91805.1 NAD(P)-dependent dehydrogenase (short-subunit alcohol dehydrogenase family) [Phyllobacterium myrsinacearum]RZV05872.1 NAD(P)-dependent dehydrogenase (short-subunit alcohol dehydrogenase family) [Phyllobacterium myrsinacearum]
MMPSAIFPDLKDRSVLITGGGSGIGAALTEGFVRQGSRVAFIDIADEASQALAERLGREYGNRPLYLNTDLRDIEALRASVGKATGAHGPVTVLVNNAAWDDRHDIDEVTAEYWDKNQSINLRPQFFAAQAVAPGMRQAGGGSIVNFTSTSFMINQGNFPSYTAAKAGIIGLTKGLAGRLGPENIRVNAIAPGWVITERQRDLWVTEDGLKSHIAKQVLKEEIQPGDMVGPCLFLASDAARMLTAQTLIVDGGYL